MALEAEMQLQDAPIEWAAEAMSLGHLPLSVYNRECNILVWLACLEPDCQGVWCPIWFEVKLWSNGFISQIRVKNIEFVTLDHFWWWILWVVVCLVVFVPLKSLFNTVEKSRLPSHVERVNWVWLYVFTELLALNDHNISKLLLIWT